MILLGSLKTQKEASGGPLTHGTCPLHPVAYVSFAFRTGNSKLLPFIEMADGSV